MISGNIRDGSSVDCHNWAQVLLNSYARLTGSELLARNGDEDDEARRLNAAPFVVVSHDNSADPILNYGNAAALRLWEVTWEELIQLPSRLTAEAGVRAERQRALEAVARNGFVAGYSGIRISARGHRFRIHDATIWELHDQSGNRVGQAATFRHWTDA